MVPGEVRDKKENEDDVILDVRLDKLIYEPEDLL